MIPNLPDNRSACSTSRWIAAIGIVPRPRRSNVEWLLYQRDRARLAIAAAKDFALSIARTSERRRIELLARKGTYSHRQRYRHGART